MANKDHLEIFLKDRRQWNKWRKDNPGIRPDLSGIKFNNKDFNMYDLSNVDLQDSSLDRVYFIKSNLENANLSGSHLKRTRFYKANLKGAIFENCDLTFAKMTDADLRNSRFYDSVLLEVKFNEAKLMHSEIINCNLEKSRLIETDLRGAKLRNCSIYGISAWNILTDSDTIQKDLKITPEGDPEIQVDDIEVAQFIYLLLKNDQIRDVITLIGNKGVLLLGRFIPERKVILDQLREELKERGLVPMMFDFDKSSIRDFTETIKILAGLSRFVIADITNPKSSPLELQATIPDYQIPFITIIQDAEKPFSMFKDLHNKYSWVSEPIAYDTMDNLLLGLDSILAIADNMYKEMINSKAKKLKTIHVKDLIKKNAEDHKA